MHSSKFFLSTLKEAPADAEIASQQLMLRAGLIKRVAAGVYTWMPLGLRVLKKVEAIVREEMDRAGALELLMPAVQPAELWQESGRWEKYGPELLRFKDRHQRDFVIGPTHEEVITDVVRREIRSYRQLPVHFYQIQSKFRDEIRPRFGVMRGREFIMKDGYSFHAGFHDLEREYGKMHETYSHIFTRLGLAFRAVAADTGSIGGAGSHEFHVIAETGEDDIAYCPDSDYAANVELAEALAPATPRPAPAASLEKVATPGKNACADAADFLGIPLARLVKTIAIMPEDGALTLLLLRADHTLNEIKAGKIAGLAGFRFASEAEIEARLGALPGSIGPVGVDRQKVRVIADRSVSALSDFACGANTTGFHLTGVNFGRDCPEPELADLRNVVPGDPSPDGKGRLALCRGIEVGHIFQLRTTYAQALGCCYLDESGQNQVMEMGCYGIGISRIVGAAIEQGHDEKGIVFPAAIAPFQVAIVPLGYHRNEKVKAEAEHLYDELRAVGVDVLLDDRDLRPGSMFADMDLIGIPHRIVVGERGLRDGTLEYKGRRDAEALTFPATEARQFLAARLRQD